MADASQGQEGIDNLRTAHEALVAEHKALQAQYRGLLVNTTFKDAGLNQKHADLFIRVYDGKSDITEASVKDFAKQYDLVRVKPESETGSGEAEQKPQVGPEGTPVTGNPEGEQLQGMAGAGGPAQGGTPPGVQGTKMPQAEFQKLLSTNRDAAMQAYAEGRVATVEGNTFVDEAKRKGLIE